MLAVDTNVVVRYLIRDDVLQAERARQLLTQNPVWLAKTVILEIEWVLRSIYGLEPARILDLLESVLGLPRVSAEDAFHVAQALQWARKGLELADALHLASRDGAPGFASFDRKLTRRATKEGLSFVRPA